MHFRTHTDAGLLGGGALIPLVALAVVGTRGVDAVSAYTGVTATLVHIYKRKWRANTNNVKGLQMAAEERKKEKRKRRQEQRKDEKRKEQKKETRGEERREEKSSDQKRREEIKKEEKRSGEKRRKRRKEKRKEKRKQEEDKKEIRRAEKRRGSALYIRAYYTIPSLIIFPYQHTPQVLYYCI